MSGSIFVLVYKKEAKHKKKKLISDFSFFRILPTTLWGNPQNLENHRLIKIITCSVKWNAENGK